MSKQLTKNNSTKAQRRRAQNVSQPLPSQGWTNAPSRKKKRNNNGPNNGKAKITNVGKGLRNLGGFVGSMFQNRGLGTMAGAAISRIFGQGDYVTNAPVQNSLMGAGVPAFGDMTSGFRVKHREYLNDVRSSTDFESSTYSLNPGLTSTFPWLSTVASNFEEYVIHGAVVYLNTTSGASVASTNTALGLWGVVTQYDPSEPKFTTKQQAENYVGCQSAVPSQSLMHGIECKPSSGVLDKRYIRTGALDVDQDVKFYDWGTTQVFTSGAQASSVIGELWISYDVEFFKPRLHSGGYKAFTDYYQIHDAHVDSTIGNSRIFGEQEIYPANGSNIGTLIDGEAGTINFPENTPEGYYYIMILAGAQPSTGTTATSYSITGRDLTITGALEFTRLWEISPGNVVYNYYAPLPTVSAVYRTFFMCVKKLKVAESGTVKVNWNNDQNIEIPLYTDVLITRLNPQIFEETTRKRNPKNLQGSEIGLLRSLLNNKKLLSLLRETREEEEYREEGISQINPSTDIIQ